MVIFHSYVSLPEGSLWCHHGNGKCTTNKVLMRNQLETVWHMRKSSISGGLSVAMFDCRTVTTPKTEDASTQYQVVSLWWVQLLFPTRKNRKETARNPCLELGIVRHQHVALSEDWAPPKSNESYIYIYTYSYQHAIKCYKFGLYLHFLAKSCVARHSVRFWCLVELISPTCGREKSTTAGPWKGTSPTTHALSMRCLLGFLWRWISYS